MADVWEKDLAQKASLTTTDYIRVVGTDNVSYKQRVLDVADVMASRYNAISGSSTVTNANDALIGVWYRVYTSAANAPAQGMLFTYGADSGKYQVVYTGTEVYTRAYANSSWSAWTKQPTRDEITSLTGDVPIRKSGSVSAGASFTVEISNVLSTNEGFALVALNISGSALIGVELLFLGNGSAKVKALIGAMSDSYYTATYTSGTASNTWTITNNSSSGMQYTAIISK